MPVGDCAFLVFHAYGHSKFQPVHRSRTEAATGSQGTSSQKIWARTVDAPPVLPAAPTSSAAFWVKPVMLPHDVSLALASTASVSSVPSLLYGHDLAALPCFTLPWR